MPLLSTIVTVEGLLSLYPLMLIEYPLPSVARPLELWAYEGALWQSEFNSGHVASKRCEVPDGSVHEMELVLW